MEAFTSASLDRQQCFNMRHQPFDSQDLTCPSIRRMRIGPTNLTVEQIQTLPANLEYLDWDLGDVLVPNDNTFRALFHLPSLEHLSLRFQNPDVIQSLKKNIPYAKHLKVMDLRDNLIGDEGVAELVQGISRTNIKSLKLGLNHITDVGAKHLAWLVSQPTCQLTHLDLNCNLIGNNGGRALATALKDNTSLKTFVLYGNAQLSCGRDFVDCLQYNNSLSDWNLQQTHLECCEVSLINYWLMLNKCGRRILQNDKMPWGVWPGFLERQTTPKQDALFYFLSQKPDLVQNCRPSVNE
jgi:Leucine Rich repeat